MVPVRVKRKHLGAIILLGCLALFSTTYLLSRSFISNNCSLTYHQPRAATMKDPGSLSDEDFIKNYLSLSDTVKGLGSMGRLLNFFEHFTVGAASDLHARKNVLIAVMTAEKYLLTRAVTINRTWAQDIGENNRLYFFVGEDCKTDLPLLIGMNIVKLKGIRDAIYPPQEKVFAVLKHLYVNFRDDFKWFLRADDDVYIRVEKLVAMLNGWEWTEKLELGHPGYGMLEDRERLKLLPHETYCMGGPGVVLSAPALEALYPHLGRCQRAVEHYNKGGASEVGWFNEDVELGRCVSRTVGIGCSPVSEVSQEVRGDVISLIPFSSPLPSSLSFHPPPISTLLSLPPQCGYLM